MFIQEVIYCFLWAVLFIFSIFLQILVRVSELSDFMTDSTIGDKFDYVIVGGGSAGAIIAARLSENSKVSVLLLEAGGEGFDILNIPVLGPLKQLTELDWQHATVPQEHSCFGLVNNVSKWPSGKILGGSTHLNYMIYIKGHKNDYISWKDPHSSHWDLKDVDFYFNKSKCVISSSKGSYNGCTGSMFVRDSTYTTSLSEAILEAAGELSYTINNLNSEAPTGFMKPQLNINQFGKRWTSDHKLKEVKGRRQNLKVLTNAVAEEVLLKNGFEAYGVRYKRHGKSHVAFADVEVILSAGTVGSAKLLMLSGIGIKKQLADANIPAKIDLPVGKNLQDHVTTGLDLIILNQSHFSFVDLMLPTSAYQYFAYGTGPLSSGMVEAVGVVYSRLVGLPGQSPDLEFMVLTAGISSDKGILFRDSMGISKQAWEGYFSFLTNETVISILPVLLHPKSVGEITLDPDDPAGKPKINPKYLSEEEDVRTLVEGIRIIRRMTETTAMKKLGARFNERKFPGCEVFDFDSEEYWACYVRHLTLTVYHPVGTCKMAEMTDEGVVDYRLRVHKSNKLRVVDASIMPSLPSANTNAAVVMIAEKGADLIKEDYSTRFSSCQLREILVTPNVCSVTFTPGLG